MTAVTPGDEVTVTITGTVEWFGDEWFGVDTPETSGLDLPIEDPDVKVTVLRPDRPTRREVLEQHATWSGLYGGSAWCKCKKKITEYSEVADVAHLDHLDAVLTKWEEN